MRRLAAQDREDAYSSTRDYQTTEVRQAVRVEAASGEPISLAFRHVAIRDGDPAFVAWGGYVKASEDCVLEATMLQGGLGRVDRFEIGQSWCRVGGVIDLVGSAPEIAIELALACPVESLDIWGLTASPGRVSLGGRDISVPELDQSHLVPEVFFLQHSSAVGLDIDDELSSPFHLLGGDEIIVKKCSYCGRYLPLDPARLGALAFHKHNAKATCHQNECRACKKLRINDSLNRLRTTDQLHESSVITRERKVFLREPEILQAIKERIGRGLKSQVWEKFGRCCFRCGISVNLNEFQLDHTRPLAYLWPIDEYATCLCARCNNEKKEKFPVDFYTDSQLQRLSQITGLGLEELRRKEVNQLELTRILNDLPRFARSWEARTFAATARKVRELRPDVDLMVLLVEADAPLASSVQAELLARPLPIDQD